ncbi:aromatic amino acid transaminase [Candidatus Erwinia haradaeae]|uniref:Aminotransferase n=1 Tax=Candidatus Erwinia haradaeae TaxID=1922217 RepID=A0A451D1S1_9GAMM|nr:amino acid aminotransferase [Candidatus Erwinia haradaeae]VFP79553.1 Aspartate aminotransferase [Candidatus Erwinia haradaeae]
MFEMMREAPKDPILGLSDLFHIDKNYNKINLGIGIYQDNFGKTPVLSCVKEAEKLLLEQENTKNYLNIEGLSNFGLYTQKLLFGDSNQLIAQSRMCTAQTPGGTGALRITADFLASHLKKRKIWISNPSWPNYKNIFASAGFEVVEYNYINPIKNNFDFEAMTRSLDTACIDDIVLLQGCCHNPTGIDPSAEQWKCLANISLDKGWFPVFDFAYQGFAQGLEKDMISLRIFATTHTEFIICTSYSKNFSLYNERVGSLTIVASHDKIAKTAFSHIKSTIRANYSSPPSHGAAIVTTILQNKDLRNKWKEELNIMKERIQDMRKLLVKHITIKTKELNLNFITEQNGMFSLLPLTPKQILRLRNEFGIYLIPTGRINIAGINLNNISLLCDALNTVL